MQVFVPYSSPIEVAKCLDEKRRKSQINECTTILNTLKGYSTAFDRHPIMAMFRDNIEWLEYYQKCLEKYRDGDPNAEYYSKLAESFTPEWMTEEFCDQHKRRLYTKSPEKYPQFAEYGTSDENWYVDAEGNIIKYRNGERICCIALR